MLLSDSEKEYTIYTPKTVRDHVVLAMKGFVIGAIDVVAGVSGGTMAIIVGIYRDILYTIQRFNGTALRLLLQQDWTGLRTYIPWRFLIFVNIGSLAAVLTLSKMITWGFARTPLYIWAGLFGLITASAWYVRKEVRTHSLRTWTIFIFGIIIAFFFVDLLPGKTPEHHWFIVITGMLTACAALLPGLSGSFTLILLGKYEFILRAAAERDIITLGLFGLGSILGLLLFVRVVSWLLDHYHDTTMALIAGLMIGSIRKMWPWRTQFGEHDAAYFFPSFTTTTMVALVCMIVGFLFVVVIHRWARRNT